MNTDPVLITGVGKRAGHFIANSFLKRGVPVIGTYRTRYARLEELRCQGAELYCCDFNEADAVQGLVEKIISTHDSLRGIIHNASAWLSDDASFPPNHVMGAMMRIHAGVPYELNRALAPLLFANMGSLGLFVLLDPEEQTE